MNKAALVVLGILFAVNATADDHVPQWRIGASLAYSDFQTNDGSTNDGGTGIKAHAQYRFNQWLGLEGAYYVSPDFKGDLNVNVSTGQTETSYQGVTLEAIGYVPLPNDRVDLFLKGGYFSFYDRNIEIDGVTADSSSDDGLALGMGVAFDAGDSLGVRCEFDWYDTSGADLWTLGIGVEYRF